MKILAKNKRAFYDFEIIDTLVAGIKLTGHEVKSLKDKGNIQLNGTYVTIHKGDLYLAHLNIPPYSHASKVSLASYDPERFRKLLVTKKQLAHIAFEKQAKKLVIIPTKIFIDHNLVKVEIALAKPLKKYEKKNRRKEREEKLKVQKIKRTVQTVY